jgi:glycosyltransferase involved in cell wall biosynthesis
MKLAWVSAPPWAMTGYGKVTREFITRMKYPEEVCVISTGGLHTGPFVEWNGIKVYPGSSSDAIKGDVRMVNLNHLMEVSGASHWVIHNDAWAFRNTIRETAKIWPCITYSPIDGGHVSAEEYDALSVAQERIAMCDYAEREIKKTGLSCVNIPHGVDTKIFKPQPRDPIREKMKIPKDKFIFGFVGTNISKRKGQAEFMMGLKKLIDKGYDDFIVIALTNINGQAQGGYDLYALADYIGVPRNIFHFPKMTYQFTEEEMAEWYNSFDVLVNISRGEGFGIPILEAQACGTPAIVTDFSSMTELVDGHGWLVPPKALDVYTLKTQYLAIVDPDSFAKHAETCINNPDLVKSSGKRAHQFAQKYDWDKIGPRWDRVLRRLDQEGYFPPYNVKEYK